MAAEPLDHMPSSPRGELAWKPIVVALAAAAAVVTLTAGRSAELAPAGFVALALVAFGVALAVPASRSARLQTAAARATLQSAAPAEPPPAPFGAVLELLEDPILLITGDEPDDLAGRRLVYANTAARELFRANREGAPLVTLVRDPGVLEAVDEALFGGISSQTVYESGGVQDRVWRVRTAPVGRRDGGRTLALIAFRDETELRRSERTRADFLANASHELRTPLASLAGFIETLRGHARDDSAVRDRFLGIMHDQAGRMARLIEDLMSLSRIELNEHIPPQGRVDLRMTTRDVIDALAPLAAERCVRFELRLPDEPALIEPADRDQVLQVIQNLAENALKYAPRGSAVDLEARIGVTAEEAMAPRKAGAAHLSLLTPDHAADRRYVLLQVSDLGGGMAREHLPRLTERFYRVEGQKGGERSGTGLGLAIAKHIMNRHRGGLVVESAVGEGAIFSVYFPMGGK